MHYHEFILDHMQEAVGIIRPDGTLLYFNRMAQRYQELLKEPLQAGIVLMKIMPEEYEELTTFIVQDVMESKSPQRAEYAIPDASGQRFFFDVNFFPVNNRNGDTETICIMAREITPEKSVEKKSVQLIKELADFVEHAHALIFSVDTQGYITEWNRECVRLTGFPKEAILTKRFEDLFFKPAQDKMGALSAFVYQGDSFTPVECEVKTASGKPITILLNATPKVSGAGKMVGAIFVGQDITELAQYRVSLERTIDERTKDLVQSLQKEKGLVEIKNKFVSMASHEFKMPLRAISSSLGYLQQYCALPPEGETRLKQIGVQVSHMKTMLEDMLALGSVDNPAIVPTMEAVDLVAFLQQIILEVAQATNQSHVFITDFETNVITVAGDEKLFRNIFINLLSNAVNFSPVRKEVRVRVSTTEQHVEVTIQDFGIGIAHQELQKIFDPFSRGSNAGGITGTGLGLSIVKKAVEALGGTVTVSSQLNEGTTFTICLTKGKMI